MQCVIIYKIYTLDDSYASYFFQTFFSLYLRNALTKLMESLVYGKNYKYPHDYENNFVNENYMPENLTNNTIYLKKTDKKKN